MLNQLTPVLLLALVTLLLVLVLLVMRALRGGGLGGLQQQLIELRGRLEALTAAQHELPRTIADGATAQARSLVDLRERLARLEDAIARLEEVGRTVAEVQQLLRVPKLRGTLGEVWLEELLRQVFPTTLYRMQHAFRSGETVDAVLRIGDRLLPIDAKFPLEACQRMLQAEADEAARARRAFQRSLRDRVDEIADRYIRPEEGTFEFAFMYIPAERVYYEAVVREGGPADAASVVAYALERQVIPVSPHTFYAYLMAMLHGLRGLEVEQRAREILGALDGLERQLERFQRTFDLLGRHLDHAAKQHHDSGRQLTTIRDRLRAFGAAHGAPPQPHAPAPEGDVHDASDRPLTRS